MVLCCFLRRIILSTFFNATYTAAAAIYAEFKFYPYYNFGFHLDAITSFFCHIFRALYDLAAFLLRVVATPIFSFKSLLLAQFAKPCFKSCR